VSTTGKLQEACISCVKEGEMNRRWTSVVTASVAAALLLAALAPNSSASPPIDSSTIHIVRPGETLYRIARYYGVDMWVLARTNHIVNPNLIYVGQRLIIPTGGTAGFIHVVQPGETLTRIALRYGVSMWAIARANGIYNLNHIWVGQRLLIPTASPPPTPPPTDGTWYGQYYNNLTLTDPPCATRNDSGINFNWGWGAPMAGVDIDYFSVRWTRTFSFLGGTYRFYARVDDGVRVWVDGTLIIDQWHDGALRTFSADVTLGAGDHDIRVEYYDRTQVARIHFWWEPLVKPPEDTVTPTPSEEPVAGWSGQYYANAALEGSPHTTRQDSSIGFEWGAGSPMPGMPSDYFSARWTTTADFNTDTYRFCAMSDDGVRIWVDDHLVLNEWHPSNAVAYCGAHWVESGTYDMKVEYFEGGGDALIYVWWEPH
jgi:LysM repeat protein